MIERFLRDSLMNGIIMGVISISLNYILLINIHYFLNRFEATADVLKEPRIQLIILTGNIILFRFLIVKWNRLQTGSGLLIIIFAAAVWYIYNNRHLLHS